VALFFSVQALAYLFLWAVIFLLTRSWGQIRIATRDPHIGRDYYTPERQARLRTLQAASDPSNFARQTRSLELSPGWPEAVPPQNGEKS
jgi:hypothetical protein